MTENTSHCDRRKFKDPIYDYMSFDDRICSIIDTKQFQRLRHVKQLGTSYYVWPGASHNRFEHCLGVAYLSQKMIKHLKKRQPKLGITDRDVFCVTAAGLCHDLGHGPWSHVWDSLFIPMTNPKSTWTHEEGSEMMFDAMVAAYNLDISVEEAILIKALIAGEPSRVENPKLFLFDIVANKRNGLDVDKFDYIARDTRNVDQQGPLSLTRLIHSARVINDQICYNIKDANQIYEVFWTRFSLHKRIYNHKTAKAIEYMIIDALLAAEPVWKIAERVSDPHKFVHLTDDIKGRIEASDDPALREAQDIFERINSRDLYKLVDYKVFSWQCFEPCRQLFSPDNIVAAAKRGSTPEDNIDEPLLKELASKHVIVDFAKLHHGMKNEDPMQKVWFYSKRKKDECRLAGDDDISLLKPRDFGEVMLRVYTRDNRFFGLIQAGYRALVETFEHPLAFTPTPGTPRHRKPLSRVATEASLATTDEEMDVSPGRMEQNSFTTVPKHYQHPTSSPLKRPRELGAYIEPEENSRPRKRIAK